MKPILHSYQTYRRRGNGRIRMALAVMFFAGYVMGGLSLTKSEAKGEVRIERVFYDPLCDREITYDK